MHLKVLLQRKGGCIDVAIIDISIKKHCIELSNQGLTAREVYNQYFSKVHEGHSFAAFRVSLQKWKKKAFADEETLNAGTYPGFIAHNATVQVNGNGEVVQAWIKQGVGDNQYDELLDVIRENTKPVEISASNNQESSRMLEIPLFDMHFPLTNHIKALSEILEIIELYHRDEINIIIGQDLFHNDDFRGRTSSGRQIEKVNIAEAWEMAKTFWFNVIKCSLEHSNRVKIIYSKGNHDESLGWAFVQMLQIAFPQVDFDNSMKARKCIYWRECFIGVSHGCNKKSANNDIRGQFTIEFPEEFAKAKVREVHLGHLHHEREGDIYGVMIRRISTNIPTDEWSDNEGFVGAHKRFMLFDWTPGKLKDVHYI